MLFDYLNDNIKLVCEIHYFDENSELASRFDYFLLLILKPAAQAQVGKIELFINFFRNPTSTCATEN